MCRITMHRVATHVTATQGTCLGKYVFNNALPQECNESILHLASMSKHGITLILY